MSACQAARWQPSKENPGGDCGATPQARAVPLGNTGRYLRVCAGCAPRYGTTVALSEVPEP